METNKEPYVMLFENYRNQNGFVSTSTEDVRNNKEEVAEEPKKKTLEDLDLKSFSGRIDKSKLFNVGDDVFDYNGDLDFSGIDLNSLSEIPLKFNEVTGIFDCSNNNLISLNHLPNKVGSLICRNNFLLSKATPCFVKGSFSWDGNPFEITDDAIKTIKKMSDEQKFAETSFFDEHDVEASNKFFKAVKDIINDKIYAVDKELRNRNKFLY